MDTRGTIIVGTLGAGALGLGLVAGESAVRKPLDRDDAWFGLMVPLATVGTVQGFLSKWKTNLERRESWIVDSFEAIQHQAARHPVPVLGVGLATMLGIGATIGAVHGYLAHSEEPVRSHAR